MDPGAATGGADVGGGGQSADEEEAAIEDELRRMAEEAADALAAGRPPSPRDLAAAASLSDVAMWLQGQGLGAYAAALEAEGFNDLEDLQSMDPADLAALCAEIGAAATPPECGDGGGAGAGAGAGAGTAATAAVSAAGGAAGRPPPSGDEWYPGKRLVNLGRKLSSDTAADGEWYPGKRLVNLGKKLAKVSEDSSATPGGGRWYWLGEAQEVTPPPGGTAGQWCAFGDAQSQQIDAARAQKSGRVTVTGDTAHYIDLIQMRQVRTDDESKWRPVCRANGLPPTPPEESWVDVGEDAALTQDETPTVPADSIAGQPRVVGDAQVAAMTSSEPPVDSPAEQDFNRVACGTEEQMRQAMSGSLRTLPAEYPEPVRPPRDPDAYAVEFLGFAATLPDSDWEGRVAEWVDDEWERTSIGQALTQARTQCTTLPRQGFTRLSRLLSRGVSKAHAARDHTNAVVFMNMINTFALEGSERTMATETVVLENPVWADLSFWDSAMWRMIGNEMDNIAGALAMMSDADAQNMRQQTQFGQVSHVVPFLDSSPHMLHTDDWRG
jgi:hypothetical protein